MGIGHGAGRWRCRMASWLAPGWAGIAACAATGAPPGECPADSRVAYEPYAFFGYACAGACARHKAGFAWAEQQGIANAEACAASPAEDREFLEGCRAYAESAVSAERAGLEWAQDNELADACACAGAGQQFEAGCARWWSSRDEAFPAPGTGR